VSLERFRLLSGASSSSLKWLARESMGRRWVHLPNVVAATPPTRWVGLSGLWSSGWGPRGPGARGRAGRIPHPDLGRIEDVVGVVGALDLLV
jgi:hypothetical protein